MSNSLKKEKIALSETASSKDVFKKLIGKLFSSQLDDSPKIEEVFKASLEDYKKRMVRRAGFTPTKSNKIRFAHAHKKLDGDTDHLKSEYIGSKLGLSEIYPYLNNLFMNMIHKIVIMKDKSKENLFSPWQILDGISLFFSSPNGFMPYKWASSIKIVDSNGDNVCLVDHNKRHLAKILVAAPDLYSLLLFFNVNKKSFFKEDVYDDPKRKEIMDRLEALTIFLFQSYSFNFSNVDPGVLLSACCDSFLSSFFNSLNEKEVEEELPKLINGEKTYIEEYFWSKLRLSFYFVIGKHMQGDSIDIENSYKMSYELINELKDQRYEINEETIEQIIKNVLTNNLFELKITEKAKEETLVKDTDEYIPIYDLSYLKDIENYSEIWTKGTNFAFDYIVTDKKFDPSKYQSFYRYQDLKHPRNKKITNDFTTEDLDEFFKVIGVKKKIIENMPGEVKETIVDEIFNNLEHVTYASNSNFSVNIITILARYYNKYYFFNKHYNFDIFEARQEISSKLKIDDED